ncbi:Esterase TesA precursor [Legionella shakespearei DSM 23087]|uniref:Esterase TesA n=1 Tax=Legionella shakespearei DSM 23087 TaxID=1122169 RepID=A0A0W0YHG4_9GAMM|nr:Esterase TesA precursor [Legionella shakespearei DSM 23087]
MSLFIIAPIHAKTILIVGDSLSAGYGIDVQKGWVNLLSEKLQQQGDIKVINISTSGDTTSNGLAKLAPALKKYNPDVVIIELGANDGLRGLSVSQMQTNLGMMVADSQKSGAKVLLLTTYLPPNYGTKFLQQFANAYKEVSQTYKVPVMPMFLEGVALHDDLMQSDGLHPNEKAQPIILENIWPYLKTALDDKSS